MLNNSVVIVLCSIIIITGLLTLNTLIIFVIGLIVILVIELNSIKTKQYKTDKSIYRTFLSSVYRYDEINNKWIKASFDKQFFKRAYSCYQKKNCELNKSTI